MSDRMELMEKALENQQKMMERQEIAFQNLTNTLLAQSNEKQLINFASEQNIDSDRNRVKSNMRIQALQPTINK